VQIFASEHFVEVVQAWTCSAAPVHDPETGELIGVIDLTGRKKDVHPQSLALAAATARAVEAHLRNRMHDRDDRLRARYQARLSGGGERRALVGPAGRLLTDDSSGWLRGVRLELPPGGGELALPSGGRALAEPVGHEEAFIVRELGGRRTPHRRGRDELRRLADEQAALRRLALVVARDVAPGATFAAVAGEIRSLLGADSAAVARFELDRTVTCVGGRGERAEALGVGTRLVLDDSPAVAAVFRSGRSARVDDPDCGTVSGTLPDDLRRVATAVAGPVVVENRLWGAIVATTDHEPLPADAEERMASFAALVGIVIADAESRVELKASRARLAAAVDEARRIQHDLHDGAQQRLASTVIALKLARRELGEASGPGVELVDEALAHAEGANRELRELAHGIMPSSLSRGGLREAIDVLVSHVRQPVSVDVTAERLPAALEANAYFIVAEALTNAIRHARARNVEIRAVVDGDVLWLGVRDDGVGGARVGGSFGLAGLRDRAAALNGDLRVESAPGKGTLVAATLPIPAADTAR
jgi:signal transduction histidine kinase